MRRMRWRQENKIKRKNEMSKCQRSMRRMEEKIYKKVKYKDNHEKD
jgi:hypothetical protein